MAEPEGVEIRRDAYGIPRIRGDSAADVAYGQGLAAAQDRAWQLTWLGWRATGRTAEYVGPAGLSWDVFARQVGLAASAQRGFAALQPESAQFVAAYAAGVNAGLASANPPELAALGVEAGEAAPWPDWMPLGAFLVHHILFGTMGAKLWRWRVADEFGVPALDVLRRDGGRPSPAIVGGNELPPLPLDVALVEEVLAQLGAPARSPSVPTGEPGFPESGSNGYAVGGARTASGRPIVAGDPHRLHELPNVYHQVQLTGPDFDVLGIAFVGVPGAPHFAHNGPVAWGITNAIADYQDLFVEQLRSTGTTVESRAGDGWAPVTRGEETIRVRGGEPVVVPTLTTRHGPVVAWLAEDRVVALRTPALGDRPDLGLDTLLPLLRARSAADVCAAYEGWVEPVNNVVVADAAGAVEYRTAGSVPRRSSANQWLPVPGRDEAYAWQGLLGRDELPRWSVPPDGQLVTANQRISAESAAVGIDYAEPERARRIHALIGDRRGLQVDDLAAIQADVWQPVPPEFASVLEELEGLTPTESAMARRILAFDGTMAAGSVAAGEFAAWRTAVARRIADDPRLVALLDSGLTPFWSRWFAPAQAIGRALPRVLAERAFGVDVAAAVRAALTEVAGRADESWGSRHRYRPDHALTSLGLTAASPLDSVPVVELSGDTLSVQANHSVPGVTDASVMGPVARYVWDLADRDASRWVVPMGASGDPASPHFADQLAVWAAGGSIPVTAR